MLADILVNVFLVGLDVHQYGAISSVRLGAAQGSSGFAWLDARGAGGNGPYDSRALQ